MRVKCKCGSERFTTLEEVVYTWEFEVNVPGQASEQIGPVDDDPVGFVEDLAKQYECRECEARYSEAELCSGKEVVEPEVEP